jgi:hypothetical protein
MSTPRIRPRSSIADAELAREATVDLPRTLSLGRPHAPGAMLRAVATMQRTIEPERVIVMPLQIATLRIPSRRR